MANKQQLNVLVEGYFHKNLKYSEILQLLQKKHSVSISLNQLKKLLYALNLKRKNIIESDIEDICVAVIAELSDSGFNLGYRALWSKLKKKYLLTVKRDTVYEILKVVDPDGLADRFANRLKRRQYLSPGPNFVWHLDGYDKLKPFGFAIHGCLDGFSRYVIWLEVSSTNKDPKVTAYYFLSSIQKFSCLPSIIRSDKGTENVLIEALQINLRKEHHDKFSGISSYIKGKSIHNQRIESFWGQIRKHSMDFYIQFFKCMINEGLFDGSDVHKQCLQYAFGPLIKKDLQMTLTLWNEYNIRKQAAQNNIAGRPYALYNLPNNFGAADYKKIVCMDTVQDLKDNLTTTPKLVDSAFEFMVQQMTFISKQPRNPEEALQLYIELLNRLQ